jgi:Leucine-rich repeat (LRR) protein
MTEYTYRLSYRRRKTPVSTCIRLCRIVTLENLNKPIPIKTTILYCNNLHLAQLPKTPVTSVAGHSTCESIGNLIHLQELHCSYNQLKELPKTPLRRL